MKYTRLKLIPRKSNQDIKPNPVIFEPFFCFAHIYERWSIDLQISYIRYIGTPVGPLCTQKNSKTYLGQSVPYVSKKLSWWLDPDFLDFGVAKKRNKKEITVGTGATPIGTGEYYTFWNIFLFSRTVTFRDCYTFSKNKIFSVKKSILDFW